MSGFFKRQGDKAVDASKKIVGYDNAKSGWSYILELANKINPKSIKPGRIETFQAAYERQGLNDQILADVYKNHVLRFYFAFLGVLVGLIVVFSYLLSGSWLVLIPSIGFFAVCLGQMFSASFRVYQIRIRQFVPVSQWLSNKSEWFPMGLSLPKAPQIKPGKVVKVVKVAVKTTDKK